MQVDYKVAEICWNKINPVCPLFWNFLIKIKSEIFKKYSRKWILFF